MPDVRGRKPTYVIGEGTHRDHWRYLAPECECSGFAGMSSPSLWLRGVVARPEDDPYQLAGLYRDASESMVNEWRRSGRSLPSIMGEMIDLVTVDHR